MEPIVALLDACVLYPAPLRDLLIQLSVDGLYQAKWTQAIHDEWITNLLDSRSDLNEARLRRTQGLMNLAVPDCLVEKYESLIPQLKLPDQDDRHVLAAAIQAKAHYIVTFNLKDFPQKALSPYQLESIHPDIFIELLMDFDDEIVIASARACLARLQHPAKTTAEYLSILRNQGLIQTASRIAKHENW